MNTLEPIERECFEKMFQMESGYVLDFTNAKFEEFFARHGVQIYDPKYAVTGQSKAKRMRCFWDCEPDATVAPLLEAMLEFAKEDAELYEKPFDMRLFRKCQTIVRRLQGKSTTEFKTGGEFLNAQFATPDLNTLPLTPPLAEILNSRIHEANLALNAGANMSVIFLCGSVLEGILLGVALADPKKFNQAKSSPKDRDKCVKQLHEWTLSEFINVATEIGLLKPDVKKFSHGLREFRNYIHPYEQLSKRFSPDEHTARICMQVMKAAIASLSGKRN